MKLDLYMYDRPIELDEKSTMEFLMQYEAAKEMMKELLDIFSDDDTETRQAMFFCLCLRTLIDDFLEFCTEDVPVNLMEELLNGNEEAEREIFLAKEEELYGCDEGEILVEFDDDEEEE